MNKKITMKLSISLKKLVLPVAVVTVMLFVAFPQMENLVDATPLVSNTASAACGGCDADSDPDGPDGAGSNLIPACTLKINGKSNATIFKGDTVEVSITSTDTVTKSTRIRPTQTNISTKSGSTAQVTINNVNTKKLIVDVVSPDGNTGKCEATITVQPLPVCTIELADTVITQGETTTLSWTTANAGSVSVVRDGVEFSTKTANTGKTIGGSLAPNTYTYKVKAQKAGTDNAICTADLTVKAAPVVPPPPPPPPTPTPVNGQCGPADRDYAFSETAFTGALCAVGTPSGQLFPGQGGSNTYTCSAQNGGEVAQCTVDRGTPPPPTPVDGQCGPAARTYNADETAFTGAFCTVGAVSGAVFPSQGASGEYTCSGVNNGAPVQCPFNRLSPVVETPPTCVATFSPASQTAGVASTLNITTTDGQNTGSVVSANVISPLIKAIAYEPATDTGAIDITQLAINTTEYTVEVTTDTGVTAQCVASLTTTAVPPNVPVCTAASFSPNPIDVNEKSTLTITTQNAVSAVADNGLGPITINNDTGSIEFEPTQTGALTFNVTVKSDDGTEAQCPAAVLVVNDLEAPTCTAVFSPASVIAGRNSELTITGVPSLNSGNLVSAVVTNSVNSSSINLDLSNNTITNTVQSPIVVADIVYTVVATSESGLTASCEAPLKTVTESNPGCTDPNSPDFDPDATVDDGSCTFETFTCGNSVNFTVSDDSVRDGSDVLLKWTTDNVRSLSINNGVNSTELNDEETVRISDDITFAMDVVFTDGTTDQCTVDVSVGGGGSSGGGSSRPSCTFNASDTSVRAGETVTLSWDTRRTNNLILTDSDNNTLVSTLDLSRDDKEEFFDSELDVEITEDTTFELEVRRGSRSRTCTVEVEVEGNEVIVLSERDQQPLVAGIALTQLPQTGFEAGPTLTVIFYLLLALWGMFIAYVWVIQKEPVLGISLPLAPGKGPQRNSLATADPKVARPEDFVEEKTAEIAQKMDASVVASAPVNLPTAAPAAPIADAAPVDIVDPAVDETDATMRALEEQAHQHKALLSSDAMRFLIEYKTDELARINLLEKAIVEAKVNYPTEDGWVVINRERIETLCSAATVVEAIGHEVVDAPVAEVPEPVEVELTVDPNEPVGESSLAEAMATGNIAAAYIMMGENPFLALADAAEDLDRVFRARKGEAVEMSDLLAKATAQKTEAQLTEAITAITSAIDGTYADEVAAVKMSILKATKALA